MATLLTLAAHEPSPRPPARRPAHPRRGHPPRHRRRPAAGEAAVRAARPGERRPDAVHPAGTAPTLREGHRVPPRAIRTGVAAAGEDLQPRREGRVGRGPRGDRGRTGRRAAALPPQARRHAPPAVPARRPRVLHHPRHDRGRAVLRLVRRRFPRPFDGGTPRGFPRTPSCCRELRLPRHRAAARAGAVPGAVRGAAGVGTPHAGVRVPAPGDARHHQLWRARRPRAARVLRPRRRPLPHLRGGEGTGRSARARTRR